MCRESLCCRQWPDGKRTQEKLCPMCLSYRTWGLRVQNRKSVLEGAAEGLSPDWWEGVPVVRKERSVVLMQDEALGTPGGTCPSPRQHPTFAEERSRMDLGSLVSIQARAAREVRAVPWLSQGPAASGSSTLGREGSTLPASFSPGRADNHKQLSAGKRIVRKESDEILWMAMCSGEREELEFVTLTYWAGIICNIHGALMEFWWGWWVWAQFSCATDPGFPSLPWTLGVLFFPFLLFASGTWNFIAWI